MRLFQIAVLLLVVTPWFGGALAKLSPSPSPSPAVSPTPVVSPSPKASPSPAVSSSPKASPSPIPTPSPTGSPSPSPSATPTPSPSPSPVDPIRKKIDAILAKMDDLNPKLKDYVADVSINADLKLGILSVPVDVHGKSYYKRPDRYKIVLENAPALLQKQSGNMGYRPIRAADYIVTLLPEESIGGRPMYVLRFDKKDSGGDFRGQTVWVDKDNYTAARHTYTYKSDGKVEVNFKWRKQSDFYLLEGANASIAFPKVSVAATASATYSGYKFNVGLDDSVFAEPKK